MSNLTYQKLETENDIDILLGKTSRYNDFSYTYTPDTIALLKKYFKTEDSLYLIVWEGGKFAGFVSCDRNWWEPNCFFIREIFVEPSLQKQGVGRTLMDKCIKHARANTASCIVTQTALENIPMQKLCEKLGFVRWDNPQWNEGITYKLIF